MHDTDCVAFLQWALPRLGLRWAGFRKVRRQVCKRIARRMATLDLDHPAAYRAYLEHTPDEWAILDALSHVTISRFYRDRGVFDLLATVVFPCLAAHPPDGPVRAWSAGCASGEEPYSLAILWRRVVGDRPGLAIVATDADPHMIDRARRGCFAAGSLRDAPADWRDDAFATRNGEYCVKPGYRAGIEFALQDIRERGPDGTFDIVLCRNLAFTYFDEPAQRRVLERILRHLSPNGYLVIGRREHLPAGAPLSPVADCPEILQHNGPH